MFAASAIWGLTGGFFKLIAHVPPTETLAHRFLWSFLIFAAILGLSGSLREVPQLLFASLRQFLWLVAGAVLISVNWWFFIHAVQVGRATEASLGYFIFPLVAVLAGAIFFAERISRAQWGAVGLAAMAVALLAYGLGEPPWISLLLAVTFTSYGLVKKHLGLPAMASVTCEALIATPLALLWLIYLHFDHQQTGHFGADFSDSLLLALSGTVSAFPLMLMTHATNRIRYAEVGLIQYVNPTLQFLIARFVFREAFSIWHAIAFPVIWIALAIYSVALFRAERSSRKPSTSPATLSSTTSPDSRPRSAKPASTTDSISDRSGFQ